MTDRRILLADADAFFVAVARMVDPDGAGKAPLLIVGGTRESRGRRSLELFPVRQYDRSCRYRSRIRQISESNADDFYNAVSSRIQPETRGPGNI